MQEWYEHWFIPSERVTVSPSYGFFHFYSFAVTMGILVAIIFAGYQFYRRGLKLETVLIGAVFAVPGGLFGASFFGKLGNPGYSFWQLFAFWEAGLSIHGGLIGGAALGLIVFYIIGRKEKVSLLTYMDCILPHILLSQAIGRWGNFFNSEVVGRPAGLHSEGALSWLPNFIRENMTFVFNGPYGSQIGTINLVQGLEYVMHPIFLYESFWFTILWAFIILLLPLIKNFAKNVPWKKDPQSFPTKKTAIPFNKIIQSENFEPKKYNVIAFENDSSNEELFYMKNKDIWKKAYYKNIDKAAVLEYEEQMSELSQKKGIKAHWQKGKALVKANNPNDYLIMKVGVQSGFYFFAWNFVRVILESQRPTDNLFISGNQTLSVIVIALIMAFGLLFVVLSQYILPYLFRKPGFVYEKEYFHTKLSLEKKSKAKTSSSSDSIEKNKLKEQKAKEKLDKILNKN